MRQNSFNLKTVRNAMLLFLLTVSFSTFANNSIEIEFSNPNNAVKRSVYGSSNGIDTYKTFEITIPFYDTTLHMLRFRTDYTGSCPGSVMINVNGQNSTNSGNPQTYEHKYFELEHLPVGISNFTIKSFCNGTEINGSKQLISVKVVKEADPALNLIISTICNKGKDGKYNGYINLNASGSYTNASKLYVLTTTAVPNCNPYVSVKLTNLSSNGNLPNNTISNSGFYSCNSNGTYNVRMFYRSPAANGYYINYEIPNNHYGWKNYSYTKTFRSCMERVILQPILMLSLKNTDSQGGTSISLTNPVKDELKLFTNSDDNSNYEIEIYDFTGLSVKRASLKEVNSNSTNTINVQDLKKGIYIVEIKNGDSVIREKMIKE